MADPQRSHKSHGSHSSHGSRGSRTEGARTYQGVPAAPLRRGALPKVAEIVDGEAEETVLVCHDTPDLRLLAHGRTLSGPEPDWRLTLPDGTERHAPPGAAVPVELADQLRAYAGGRTPRPVLRLRIRRSRTLLRDRAGRTLAELDRTETLAQPLSANPGPGRLAGWTGTEVRLVHGRPRLLAVLDAQLRAQGLASAPGGTPTDLLARAGVRRTGAGPARKPVAGTAGAALAGYLRTQCAELLALDAAVRRDEPDAVHRMRVCCRRLRSALTAGQKLLRGSRAGRTADELRWLGQVLGLARDAEATGERLAEACAQLPSAAAPQQLAAELAARFRRRYAAAYRQVREVLDSERYFQLLDAVRWIADRPRCAAGPATAVVNSSGYCAGNSAASTAGCAWPSPAPSAPVVTKRCTRRARLPSAPATPPSWPARSPPPGWPAGCGPCRRPSAATRTPCWPSGCFPNSRPRRTPRGRTPSATASCTPRNALRRQPPWRRPVPPGAGPASGA